MPEARGPYAATKKPITVGDIVNDLLPAQGGENAAEKLLSQIAVRGEHRDIHDSDPSRETINKYAEAPNTHCNFRFAALVLDFLDQDVAPVEGARVAAAKEKCLAVLRNPRTRQSRFERAPGSDPAAVRGLQDALGVYVIARDESATGNLRRELLIVDKQGEGDTKSYATFITPDMVCRGTWGISHNGLYCSTHGAREDYRRDIAYLTIALDLSSRADTASLLCGVLSGLSTSEFYPIVMPMLVIKMSKERVPEHFGRIGDLNDAILRRRCRALVEPAILESATRDAIERFFKTFSMRPNENISVPTNHISSLRGVIPNSTLFNDDGVVTFLREMMEQTTIGEKYEPKLL